MRLQRLRFEFRMELAAQEPGMIGQLANFNVHSVRSFARQAKTMLLQNRLILTVEFIAVAMPFADLAPAVGLASEAVVRDLAGIRAQTHGSAQLIDAFQFTQLVNYAIRSGGIELGGVRLGQTADVACELDHHGLHAQADAEIGNLEFARVADGLQHAFDAAASESARNQNAVE